MAAYVLEVSGLQRQQGDMSTAIVSSKMMVGW